MDKKILIQDISKALEVWKTKAKSEPRSYGPSGVGAFMVVEDVLPRYSRAIVLQVLSGLGNGKSVEEISKELFA